MMGWNGGSGSGGWIVMTLVLLVFWGLVIFGGMAVWRSVGRSDRGHQRPGNRGAEQLLDERFARGEIDEDEYVRRRELLHSRR